MADNQTPIIESLERQAKLQMEFTNLCNEDVLASAIATKRNVKRKISIPEFNLEGSLAKLTENDGIFIESTTSSVGYKIKEAAIKKYQQYFELPTNEKPIVILGLNSILDLSFKYPNGQSSLFNKEDWVFLCERYSPPIKKAELELSKKVEKILNTTKKIVPQNPQKATKLLFQYLYGHNHSDENDFILYTYAHIIDYTVHHKYMFDSKVPKNEQDYVNKLWSPILERLVRNSDLRLKWGESSFARIDYSNYMADVRVMIDNNKNEYDLMCVEVAKGSPTEAKLYHDHCKLMIETKDIIDNSPVSVTSIPSVQFCGHEIYAYKLTHHADNFYIGQKTSHTFVPPTIIDFSSCKKICQILLDLKYEWITFKQMMESKLNEEKNRPIFNSQKSEGGSTFKTSPHWYPPHLTQQSRSLKPLPENLI